MIRLLFILGALLASNAQAEPTKTAIDYHAHVAGIGSKGSGCKISDAMRDSYKFKIYLKAFGVTKEELEEQGDEIIFDRIAKQVADSQWVDKAVVLALDGRLDKDGNLDEVQTQVYIPNDFVQKGVAKHPNLLFGASINPKRRDALKRLDDVAKQGAVLIKWIPAIQDIDMGDPALTPFYERMKKHNLILLAHTGQERSFLDAMDWLGDPRKLELPLKIGVTVIAAHVATTGELEGQPYYERILPMFAEYPNLYADISSITQINKYGYIQKVVVDKRLEGRLVFGTDYPLINTILVSPYYFFFDLKFSQIRNIAGNANAWDRDYELKQALGVTQDVYARKLGRIK